MGQRTNVQWLAFSYSRILAPALVLVLLVALAGITAGLSPVAVVLLVLGIAVVPGLIYKRSKGLFQRWNLADHWRTNLVAGLTLLGAAICYSIPIPAPIPATVAALFVGNAGLAFFRRWLNASAHVSVITFAVLWIFAVYGVTWSWLLLLSPAMLFSRVVLREHTWREALTGTLLGLVTFCCFLVSTTWS